MADGAVEYHARITLAEDDVDCTDAMDAEAGPYRAKER